ncbi:MAG TPA: zf-HC2 domain-containing protein [Terriglobales bacterium]|jgi:anti-sigma factor RsiW|nr:zf-HC2 domain-containing protein [Terriglobales bacterium]
MVCELWHEKIGAFVDSELSSEETADVNAHLRGCNSCAAEVVERLQLKRVTQAAGNKYRYEAPLELRMKILQNVTPKKRRSWGWNWAPALAVAVLVLFAVLLYPAFRQAQAPFRELADIHTATLASTNPLDVISSDKHVVKPWYQGKLPFTFEPPELKNTPYSLLGGRLAYFQQSSGAELICQYKQHRISVFIFEDSPEWNRKPGTTTSTLQPTGMSVESWSQGGLRYVVLGDAAPDVIHGLAEMWRQTARV